MKLKRILAGALAGVMAMTSMAFTVSAADKVTTIYEFDDSLLGVETAIVIDGDAMAAISSAKSSVDFTLNGAMADTAQGWCNYGIQMVSSPYTGIWSIDVNTTKTLTPSDAEWTAFTTDTSLKFSINNIKVTTATVAVDGGSPITVYDVKKDAVSGKAFAVDSGDNFLVPASTLTDAGVTADNFADCSVTMTIDSLLGGGKQISLLAGYNWDTQFYWSNEYDKGEVTISFKDADATKAAAVLSDGLNLYAKGLLMTKLTLTVPETKYSITCSASESGSLKADKETAAAGETVTLTATPNDGYELESITVNGKAITGTTFEMPAEDVKVVATFKAVATEDLEKGTYADGTWEQVADEDLPDEMSVFIEITENYSDRKNTVNGQFSDGFFRIYQIVDEATLANKTSASIFVEKGGVTLKLTTDKVYKKLADGKTAPDGSYYIAWVISGVTDPTDFAISDITLA